MFTPFILLIFHHSTSLQCCMEVLHLSVMQNYVIWHCPIIKFVSYLKDMKINHQ